MKLLIISLIALTSLPAFSFSTSCSFVSSSYYGGQTSAEFDNCSGGFRKVSLLGENNSPCRAGSALSGLISGVKPGQSVSISASVFRVSTNGGMADVVFVTDASAGNNNVKPEKGCDSTHIKFYGSR